MKKLLVIAVIVLSVAVAVYSNEGKNGTTTTKPAENVGVTMDTSLILLSTMAFIVVTFLQTIIS